MQYAHGNQSGDYKLEKGPSGVDDEAAEDAAEEAQAAQAASGWFVSSMITSIDPRR